MDGSMLDRMVDKEQKFDVYVMNDGFKFTAAHFIAFPGFRERLHGHNYQVSLRLRGPLCRVDGYVLDFLEIKEVVKKICKEMNEHFLCPMFSDVLNIKQVDTVFIPASDGTVSTALDSSSASSASSASSLKTEKNVIKHQNIHITCEDGCMFSMPETDVLQLPIYHSSAEELARYVTKRIIKEFTLQKLKDRFITDMETTVAEMPNQQATFYLNLQRLYDANIDNADDFDIETSNESKRLKQNDNQKPHHPKPCQGNVLTTTVSQEALEKGIATISAESMSSTISETKHELVQTP